MITLKQVLQQSYYSYEYNEIRFVRLTAPCCGLSYKKHLADKRIYIVDNIHSESNEKMTASMLCRENFMYNLKNNEKLKKAIEANKNIEEEIEDG